jgi:prefoldin subunit 5
VDLKVVDRSMAEAIRIQEPIVARYEQRITELNREVRDLAKRAPEVLR